MAATSTVSDIARHALAILASCAETIPDAVAQVLQLHVSALDNTINTTDTLCCIYAIRAYERIAMAESNMIGEQLAHAAYMKIIRLLSDSRLRVQLEVTIAWLHACCNWIEATVHGFGVL